MDGNAIQKQNIQVVIPRKMRLFYDRTSPAVSELMVTKAFEHVSRLHRPFGDFTAM